MLNYNIILLLYICTVIKVSSIKNACIERLATFGFIEAISGVGYMRESNYKRMQGEYGSVELMARHRK
jgi:hypothetical protein